MEQNSESILFDLANYFYDIENGSDLEYSIYENIDAIESSIVGTLLTLIINENQIGEGTITIAASDNIDRSVASFTFNITIIEVNQPPVVNDKIGRASVRERV